MELITKYLLLISMLLLTGCFAVTGPQKPVPKDYYENYEPPRARR